MWTSSDGSPGRRSSGTGPRGTFFDRYPELAGRCCPVEMIEIWNEPNLGKKWSRADPQAYARFFKRVAATIHAARNWTPRVRLVTGGVTGLNGGPWPTNGRDFVRGMYRVDGFRSAADRIGIHTYSPTAKSAMRALRSVRRIMSRHHHTAPIVISEHGWSTCPRPSAERSNGKCVSPRGQANRLKTYARRLLAERNRSLRVESFLWFMSQDVARHASGRGLPDLPEELLRILRLLGRGQARVVRVAEAHRHVGAASALAERPGVRLPGRVALTPRPW